MFNSLNRNSKDKQYSREFVTMIMKMGPKIRLSINDALQMNEQDNIKLIDSEKNIEVSMAILGTSLAILDGNSQIMTKKRGEKINKYCKSIVMNSLKVEVNEVIKKYEEGFKKAMSENINPFGEISGILLVHSLEERIKMICIPGTNDLNPFIHQIIGDIMTVAVTEVIKYWKNK